MFDRLDNIGRLDAVLILFSGCVHLNIAIKVTL